jgi:hypothetical protein
MHEDFKFDYLLTSFSRIENSLDAIGQVATKIFNAIIRIENHVKENARDLRELEES